jgi:hypothetical protein
LEISKLSATFIYVKLVKENDMSMIFISYRREDTSYLAMNIHQWLMNYFGPDQVFMDIKMGPGKFSRHLEERLNKCEVFLVLIGPDWLICKEDDGQRRLDNKDDWVHREVAIALERDILLIPFLSEGARPPKRKEIPPGLGDLSEYNCKFIKSRTSIIKSTA